MSTPTQEAPKTTLDEHGQSSDLLLDLDEVFELAEQFESSDPENRPVVLCNISAAF